MEHSQNNLAGAEQRPEQHKDNFLVELIKFAVIAIIVIVPFRMFVAEPYIVSGASMSPTFETGHYLIIDKFSHFIDTPDRGEVLVFEYPNDPSTFYIKRVIGLPGETVRIQNRSVYVKAVGSEEFVEIDEPYIKNNNQRDIETVIPENNYFVMGDNRGNSSDSRSWGVLDEKFIKGTPLVRLYPFNNISVMPGSDQPDFINE